MSAQHRQFLARRHVPQPRRPIIRTRVPVIQGIQHRPRTRQKNGAHPTRLSIYLSIYLFSLYI
jgi:hypothetical protein